MEGGKRHEEAEPTGTARAIQETIGNPDPRVAGAEPRRKEPTTPGTGGGVAEAGTGGAPGPGEPTGHGSTPREVAEATPRGQAAQHNGKPDLDRENHMVQIGRGQQTHG